VADGGLEEGDGAHLLLVGVDLAEGQSGVVVDGTSERLPLSALSLCESRLR